MAWVLHRKTTAAMAAFYAAVAALLLYFIHDATLLAVALFVVFTLVLLAGNMYVRQGAREDGNGRMARNLAPCPLPRDPELGRR